MVGVGGSSPLGRTIQAFLLFFLLSLIYQPSKKAPALTEAFRMTLFHQRLHIDHEAVFHIAFQQTFKGIVDLVHANHL